MWCASLAGQQKRAFIRRCHRSGDFVLLFGRGFGFGSFLFEFFVYELRIIDNVLPERRDVQRVFVSSVGFSFRHGLRGADDFFDGGFLFVLVSVFVLVFLGFIANFGFVEFFLFVLFLIFEDGAAAGGGPGCDSFAD